MSDPARRDLVLTGPPGAGKTTVGRLVASRLARPFADLDDVVADREGASVATLFARGERVFREAERAAGFAWLESCGRAEPRVLALGGGALAEDGLVDALRERTTLVALDASSATCAARLDASGVAARPLLAGARDVERELARLASAREAAYARAEMRIATDGHAAELVAARVLRALHDPPSGPWSAPPRELAPGLACARGVTVGRGAGAVGTERTRGMLVDAGLPEVHAAPLRALLRERSGSLFVHEVPAGEAAKSAFELQRAWDALLDAGADRDTGLFVAGGGAVTDLGGFVAATYKRGLRVSLRPTTLLGQLDAALGGKTGIDVGGIKNAAGVVRLPDAVHVDTLTLLTLTPRLVRCGLAEAVKSALVGDAGLLELLEREADRLGGDAAAPLPVLEEVVRRAARVKLAVVERDLEEAGPRRALNLGHTAGHALEAAAAVCGLDVMHGEAVAVGLVVACRLAASRGTLEERALPERVEALLNRLGLPVRIPELGERGGAAFRAALAHDKKIRRGAASWVLPRRAGEVAFEEISATEATPLALEPER